MSVGSLIKDKLSSAVHHDSTSSSPPPSGDGHNRALSSSSSGSTTVNEKFMLRVTAGPSYNYDTHKLVKVNQDDPCVFENEHMSIKVNVKIKDFHGLPRASPPNHAYFDDPSHHSDRYAISFSFVPKRDIPSAGTVWGNTFPHKISSYLPPGFNTAFGIVKRFIDPGLECDAYAEEPWLLGPSLSCWFSFFIGDKTQSSTPSTPSTIIHEGGSSSGDTIRKSLNMPNDGPARRKWALNPSHHSTVTFEKDREYMADFYNPYLDFSNFSLKLPGFSLNVLKYVDDKTHKLRYVFMNKEKEEVYFVVIFSLLHGEELQEKADEDAREAAGGSVGGTTYEATDSHHSHDAKQSDRPLTDANQQPAPPSSAPSGETDSTHQDAQGNVFHHSADDVD